jgi:hypothetical protein
MALTIAQLKNLVNTNLADNSNIVPLEHREVELALIDYLETLQPITNANAPSNKGYVTANNQTTGGVEVGINLGTTLSDKLRYFGNILSVTVNSTSDYSILTVNLQNPMPNNNYVVKHWLEQIPSSATPIQNTSSIVHPVFKVISNTQFQFVIKESSNQTQNIRVHFEIFGY